MTALLERERTTAVEERVAPEKPVCREPPMRPAKRFRTWMAALAAVAVVGAGAAAVSLTQADATEALSYRAVGEVEAIERFASVAAVPGLSYRAVGEVEAVERFASA